MPVFLNTKDADFDASFDAFLANKRETTVEVDDTVAAIIDDVRKRGDTAVIELTAKFDHFDLTTETLAFTSADIDAAIAKVPVKGAEALQLSADRIRTYHAKQLPQDAWWQDATGAHLGWRWSAEIGRAHV